MDRKQVVRTVFGFAAVGLAVVATPEAAFARV